eukprot:m.154728 g.154728  ORF g.154728 m.154728 type:complete len:637 (+) comp38642_c0_seq1:943-2853(+)
MASRQRSASIPFTPTMASSIASWGKFKRQASKKSSWMSNERWLTLKLKPKGRPKTKYLKDSSWWPVQYLGTVEAVKDWTAPGSRSELLEFIERAQDGLQTISQKGGPPKLLWISDQWIHVTDHERKKVYALSRTESISSFCHATEVEGDHFLAIKILNPKTKRNDCVTISSHDISIIQQVSEALKIAIEAALERNNAKIQQLMLLRKGIKRSKRDIQPEYEEIKTMRGQLPPSTVRFLDAEARAMEYDVPSNRPLPPYSLHIRPSSEMSSIASTSEYADYADYADHLAGSGHYQTPRGSVTSSLDSPDSGYSKPMAVARSTSAPALHYQVPPSGRDDYPAAYEEMNIVGEILTVVRKEATKPPPASLVDIPEASEEEIYEPLDIHSCQPISKATEPDNDSGLEDNDSAEIQMKPAGKPKTYYSKMVRHFAAGDPGDLYAVVEKNGGGVNYEEERQEFLNEAKECIGPVRFREFQDIIALYDRGEADLVAMARRARLLFRGRRWHMRQEMVKLIRPCERDAYLCEMSKRCSFTGADDLLSSLRKKKDDEPRRHVRFGFVRTKDAYDADDSNTDDPSPSSPDVNRTTFISELGEKVRELTKKIERGGQYSDGTARRKCLKNATAPRRQEQINKSFMDQ